MFFVGSHTGGQVTASWKIPRAGHARDPARHRSAGAGPQLPECRVSCWATRRPCCGRCSNTRARRGPTAARTTDARWRRSSAQDLLAEWRADVEPQRPPTPCRCGPSESCRELSAALPDDAIVVVDTGHSGHVDGPEAGASLAAPDATCAPPARSAGDSPPRSAPSAPSPIDRCVCFTGDGGFFYHATELETAARYGINAVILVNNNFSLNQDERPFTAAYGGHQHEGFEMWQFSPRDRPRQAGREPGLPGHRASSSRIGAAAGADAGVRRRATGRARRADRHQGHGAARLDRRRDAPLRPGTGY